MVRGNFVPGGQRLCCASANNKSEKTTCNNIFLYLNFLALNKLDKSGGIIEAGRLTGKCLKI